MSLVSIRGAITVQNNDKDEILQATRVLLQKVIHQNGIDIENIIQIHFSATNDLDKAYPAVAARELGITKASLMCFQELFVEGSMRKCIRLDALVEAPNLTRDTVKHQYLNEAVKLRPDLIKE